MLMYVSLPQPMMTNSDLGRLLKAFEIQSVLRAPMYVKIAFPRKDLHLLVISIVNVKLVVK